MAPLLTETSAWVVVGAVLVYQFLVSFWLYQVSTIETHHHETLGHAVPSAPGTGQPDRVDHDHAKVQRALTLFSGTQRLPVEISSWLKEPV
jgi:hypothetical protein